MKALFLVTFTNDCENKWRSFASLGHTVIVEQYDNRPHDRHGELVDLARRAKPNLIVHVGAIERYHGRPVPTPDIFHRLRDIATTIHICGDASDKPWWELLELYDREGCFAAQVSIDGSPNTPIAGFRTGMVRLTPTDPRAFHPYQWVNRTHQASIAGGRGHGERARLLDALIGQRAVEWLGPDAKATYDQMAAFLGRSKVVVNCPMNGTGDADHVKGRVIEAGYAQACLLERRNPCTARWFRPGKEYLEYIDPADAIAKIEWTRENDAEVHAMADRFAKRVQRDHSPSVFWRDVLARVGLPSQAITIGEPVPDYVDTSDIPEADESFFKTAKLREPK